MNLPIDYIAVHIRRGDKIVSREMKELGLSLYIDAVKGKKHISRNVFIATDDGSVTDKLNPHWLPKDLMFTGTQL